MDVMAFVQSGLKPFNEVEQGLHVRIKNHDALESLRKGEATRTQLDTIIAALNMTEGFVRLRGELGVDWIDEITAGQNAMFDVATRGYKTERYVCKAAELTAINLAMEIHDSQLDNSTVKDVEDCLKIVIGTIRNKKARKINA